MHFDTYVISLLVFILLSIQLFRSKKESGMQIIKNDMVVVIDCDDTLVMWNDVKYWKPGPEQVEILDPTDNTIIYLKLHKEHIKLARKYKNQGYTVIVWSAGGWRWAEAVARQLEMTDFVDICMSKPLKYVDDLPGDKVLGSRVYIPFKQTNRSIEPGEPE